MPEKVIEQYKYVPGDDEKLIVDNPSIPLSNVTNTTTKCEIPDGLIDGGVAVSCYNAGDSNNIFYNKVLKEVCETWIYYNKGKGGGLKVIKIKYDELEIGTYLYTTNCKVIPNGNYWFQYNNIDSKDFFRSNLKQLPVVTVKDGYIVNIYNYQMLIIEGQEKIEDLEKELVITKNIEQKHVVTPKPVVISNPVFTPKTAIPTYTKVRPNMNSNKELYEFYVKELKDFSLSLNGEIIYESFLDNSNNLSVKFENDFFILYGKKYSYNGLKIKKINKK